MIMKCQNPSNPSQRRVFFHGQSASEAGENRHPQIVMTELAQRHGFRILSAIPQSMHDGWDFWIEGSAPIILPYLLDYQWKSIGQA